MRDTAPEVPMFFSEYHLDPANLMGDIFSIDSRPFSQVTPAASVGEVCKSHAAHHQSGKFGMIQAI